MRKQSAYRPKAVSLPMLIGRQMLSGDIETKERMIIEAFALGYATREHYDDLADMRNVLTIAAAHKDDKQLLQLCDVMRIIFANIRDRHSKTGRMGVNGDELLLLREFCGIYSDFWQRQTARFYDRCCEELKLAAHNG